MRKFWGHLRMNLGRKCGVLGCTLPNIWRVKVWILKITIFQSPYLKFLSELGEKGEYVLAIENLTPLGYRLGPKLNLDEAHLKLMMKMIAQYHAVSYALKIKRDPKFNELAGNIKPFDFVQPTKDTMFDFIYPIALERLFDYYFNVFDGEKDEKFRRIMEIFREKFADKATTLMQIFLRQDETFSVILHGDFNRNNVLFLYDQQEGFENPKAVKMIDFQQVRYGSPAIDLSFFMFMNMEHDLKLKHWDELLVFYHEELIQTISKILGCDKSDPRLSPYSLDKFLKHFQEFAFYGAMVVIHFLPVVMASPEQLEASHDGFHDDHFTEMSKKFMLNVGGIEARKLILEIARFAFEKGYMNFLLD